jgi:hypothetical protein
MNNVDYNIHITDSILQGKQTLEITDLHEQIRYSKIAIIFEIFVNLLHGMSQNNITSFLFFFILYDNE